jgi:hypothetical protein
MSKQILELADRIQKDRGEWQDDGGRLGLFFNGTEMDLIDAALRCSAVSVKAGTGVCLDCGVVDGDEHMPYCSALAVPARTEPQAASEWCQPTDCGKPTPRKFMIYFDDPDHGIMIFDDEAEARAAFKAKNTAWSCYLFGTLPRQCQAGSAPEPTREEIAKAIGIAIYGETRRIAERLINAVNNHEALVKALEEIEDLGANGATAARLGNIAHVALIALRAHVGGASNG